MRSNEAHLEFAPTSDGGQGRALILALAVHALLLLALNWGTLWSQQPQDMSVEAELWSAIPQPVAPKSELPPEPDVPPTPEPEPQPEPPSPVAPPVKPSETAKPVVDPQIAIDKLKKKQVEEKLQQAQEDKKAKRKAEKEEEAKLKAKEKQEAEARHQAAVKRLQSMAGSAGTPVDTGVAPKASGPSASYIGRLRAKVKPNITFPDNLLQNVVGNPTAEVEVTCSPSGKIEDVNLLKPSGNKAWDDAVVNGLYKTAMLPRDVDGSVPTRLVFSFRPRD
ncbi:MAG: TonB family protein [Burkholderiaceae bacterium]|jgi:colicin import membrane protein|nr:TonB family protein [Burkholderiaceae bacterium]